MFINIVLKHFYKGEKRGFFLGFILDYKRGTLNIDNTHARTKRGKDNTKCKCKSLSELHWDHNNCEKDVRMRSHRCVM